MSAKSPITEMPLNPVDHCISIGFHSEGQPCQVCPKIRAAMRAAFQFGQQMSAAAVQVCGTDMSAARLSTIVKQISLPDSYKDPN